ncbi:hypothetical protein [Haloferula sp. A504]|uniref:hypothetical protein n=1 Tax=Haloferula sp. A504 TaxID=3373601 RepID=UPI0031CA89F2|nr:hypothetical protein [Verrucomicrobiaceae bacterium E54]
MKTSQRVAVSATLVTLAVIAIEPCAAKRKSDTDDGNHKSNPKTAKLYPEMPSGWLTAFPVMVQTGTHPTLTWGINYPSIVEDYVTIEEPATIQADEDIECEIRILGAGVTVTRSNQAGFEFVPTEAWMYIDGWDRLFWGTNLDVNPNQVVESFTLRKNEELKFGGRYYYNGWGPFFWSDSGGDNVRTLVNGDIPPDKVPDYGAPSLESFLQPYLRPDGRVNIGPMDVIVFMELTHYDSQKSDPGYDLQDMVILCTFKSKARTNNGHGNNIDGIDSSNPGSAPFINLDTDPNVDDEGSGGGAAPSNP